MATLISGLGDSRNRKPTLRSNRLKMHTLAILLAASFLTACGSGSDESQSYDRADNESSPGHASALLAQEASDQQSDDNTPNAQTAGDSNFTPSSDQAESQTTPGADDDESADEAPAEPPLQDQEPVVKESDVSDSGVSDETGSHTNPDDSSDGVESDPEPSVFKVYNSMVYTNMPAFGTRISIAGEGLFFPNGAAKADGLPTMAGFRNAADSIRQQIDGFWFATDELTVVDIERWHLWPWTTGQDHLDSVRLYAESARLFKAETGLPMCHYAVLPSAGLWHSVGATTDSSKRADLEYYTDLVAAQVLPYVDALCPSLYTFYDAPTPGGRQAAIDQWKTFAAETIRQARRVSPDKPVYAFLWPHFHNGGSYNDFREVPAVYWRAQLELILEMADGVILWGGADVAAGQGQLAWRESAPWWQVTQEVLASHITVVDQQTP